jgi:hypothetical protein
MKILFTLPELLHEDIVKACLRLRINKSEWIRKAIRNELYGNEATNDEKPKEIRLPKGVVGVHKEGIYKEIDPFTPKTPFHAKNLGTPMPVTPSKQSGTELPFSEQSGQKVVVNIHTPDDVIKIMSENMNTGKLCKHGAAPGLCQFGCK